MHHFYMQNLHSSKQGITVSVPLFLQFAKLTHCEKGCSTFVCVLMCVCVCILVCVCVCVCVCVYICVCVFGPHLSQ